MVPADAIWAGGLTLGKASQAPPRGLGKPKYTTGELTLRPSLLFDTIKFSLALLVSLGGWLYRGLLFQEGGGLYHV